jgi:hypothetical protein
MPVSLDIKHAAALLIGEDRLREALDMMLAHTPSGETAELLNLSGQLAATEQDERLQLKHADQLNVERNQVRAALLATLATLPPTVATDNRAGLQLRQAAFWMLSGMKAVLLLLILFHYSTNGYGQGETLTLILLLMPVLVGYLAKAVKTRNSSNLPESTRSNLAMLKGAVWLGFPLYALTLCWILNQHPLGHWEFETARNWIAGIEAAFGGLVLFVVNALFEDK